ncbi:Tripartite-type tricarboxylate transporter, receptor component TctC [Halomonas shengliensis]|uniref:Tripartite-type tricarboxylate transporter, receptor component TctC n=1 Tax=Halomonas shengliensis TaxID=419597 RepID=A0A1H0EU00_9GAMM|nr:tripartite tricarboxylate transporter substrate binding protein [Halomonas shengliensis]SDN85852.1 Tripartite-type tricarboxylate transporter, receptor component TctC [Halomonas shengliensis]
MPGWRGLRWVLGCWLLALALGAVAQTSDPGLRLVVPFGPGGASDVLFREVGRALERELGTSIRYDNQPGHSGMRGALLVKEAPPDGRTLLGSHQTLILAHLSGRSSLSHEAFTPVALLTRTVNIPAARRQAGVASAAELVARLQAEDASLRVGMIPDSTDAFFWRQFLQAAGLSQEALTWVGYPDTGSQVAALLGGEIDLAMLNLPAGRRLFDHGALVPLGVADERRLSALPEVPTLREQGIDVVNTTDRGLFAPPSTPREALDLWLGALRRVLSHPGLVHRLEREHGTRVDFRGPDAYADYLRGQARSLASRLDEAP